MKKIKCGVYCKTAILIVIVAGTLAMSGCAGNVKVKGVDGAETNTPAGVAVMQSAAASHATCKEPKEYVSVPMGDPCQANDTACNNRLAIIGVANAFAKMEHAEEMQEGLKDGCHAQVADQTEAYYEAEAVKYKQVGNFGQTAIRWVSGIFIIDKATDNQNQPAGDTNVETLNVNGSNVAGAGAEGTGGATGGVTQNVNIGPGSLTNAQDGASVLTGEKATIGDGNQDNDSPNTSLF